MGSIEDDQDHIAIDELFHLFQTIQPMDALIRVSMMNGHVLGAGADTVV